jgi:hypothetical protein
VIPSNANRAFVDRANPHGWLLVADNLHGQAVVLRRNKAGFTRQSDGAGNVIGTWDDQNRSVFLLGGFALENAIKAFLVYENPQWISNGTLAKKLCSHSLTSLHAMSTTIPHKGRMLWVLRDFEAGLESWARYPCARFASTSDDEGVLSDRLWQGYLRVMTAYGRKLVRLLGELWTGPHGFEGKWTFSGSLPLSDK